ncbi:transporter [Deefgea rivuli]|uniref:transporter n=1 Tax=Deefgea rivuli TaxID=400948 RepID=UPI0009FE0F98|nr:transporter [Deefgea rivuli]
MRMNGLKMVRTGLGLLLSLVVLIAPAGASDPRQFGVVADDTSRTSLRFRQQHIESPRGPREVEIIDKQSYSIRHAQYFALDGRLAYAAVQLPYVNVEQSFENSRRPSAQDDGVGDVMIGLGIGVYRVPALSRDALKEYDRNGLSSACTVQVAVPTASYVKNQSVNLTSNRWMVIPSCQLGWTQQQWVLEGVASMNWFSDNTDYRTGTFQQDNSYSMKAMASYSFIPEAWLAATLEYQYGGAVTRGVRSDNDGMNNWTAGAAVNFRLPGRNSLRVVGEWPISTAEGSSETKEISLVLSHVW